MSRRSRHRNQRCRYALGLAALSLFGFACESEKEEPEMTREEAARIVAEMKRRGALPEVSASAIAGGASAAPAVEQPPPKASAQIASSTSAHPATKSPSANEGAPGNGRPSPSAEPAAQADTIAIPEPSREQGRWLIDEPVPIAPAAPITATRRGVVMYNRAGQVVVARLGGLSRRDKPMKTPVEKTPKSAAPFPLGRGPAVVGDHAYWITQGRLVRRKIKGGPLEVLAEDAQNGTRVAGPAPMRTDDLADIPPTVAYIVRAKKEDGPLGAKLWVEGGETRNLTPEGSSTHSVTLVHTRKGILALSVQARMSMTPVHARPIRFAKQIPRLGDDIVVWVGGGVQRMTEMALLPGEGKNLWGFIPHEESITRFGLARLDIEAEPDMKTKTSWIFYSNGLDPAPVDGGFVCGEPVVAYVEPKNAEPDADQRLVVRRVGGPAHAQVVAEANAFYDVSLTDVSRGGLVSYVADWVTWATTVRCRSKPAPPQ